MYICHAPSTIAPRKATNATQKWARTSFLARNTAESLPWFGPGHELGRRQHRHPRPHRLVAGAAVLVAGHELLARLREGRREGRDEGGNQHRVGVRRADDEAVDGVRAGAAE